MLGRYAAILLGLSLFNTAALCADPAQELLRNMEQATRRLNYDGVFVYHRGEQIDSMRLVHSYTDGRVKERLISLSGPSREVIRDGAMVTCLYADDHEAVVEMNPNRDLIGIGISAPVETLLESYRFSLGDSDRVAGRRARIVAVTPRKADRYAYTLWIDEQSNLLLKSVILDRDQRVLEQVEFTRIDILDSIPEQMLQPEITGRGFTWRTDHEDADPITPTLDSAWNVEWVPRGFELKESNVQNIATSHMPVGHLAYSDGLAMVSVFIEQLMPDEIPLKGFSERGAVNAFSRVADDYQITVVGELPLTTVRRIATSVTRTKN